MTTHRSLKRAERHIGVRATLPGQHQCLGWHVGPKIVDFLASAGAELDVESGLAGRERDLLLPSGE
jgi:hypothetical protein